MCLIASAGLALGFHRGRSRVVRDRGARPHGAHECPWELGEEADAREADDESMLVVRRDVNRLVGGMKFPAGVGGVPRLEVLGSDAR